MKGILSVALVGLLLTSGICFAGYDEGVTANDNGDYETANRNFMPLAQQGDARAQYQISFMYFKGRGVPQDYNLAVVWARKAAMQGLSDAQSLLGFFYLKGEGVTQDYKEAAIWYRKAAEQGDSVAQTNLGLLYGFGYGVPKNNTEAIVWLRKGAEQGDANAQKNLNELIALQNKEVAAPAISDHKTANQTLISLAEQGNVEAQLNLATIYFESQNYKDAMVWFQKAAKQGNAKAQYEIGFMYDGDCGVQQDYKVEMDWYRKAAKQDHAGAQYNIGLMYRDGEGVKKSNKEAIVWFGKAAKQGFSGAQEELDKISPPVKNTSQRRYVESGHSSNGNTSASYEEKQKQDINYSQQLYDLNQANNQRVNQQLQQEQAQRDLNHAQDELRRSQYEYDHRARY